MKKIASIVSMILIMTVVLSGCGTKKEATKTDLLEQIKETGTMKVGLEATYPPYNFLNEKNQVDGFDADIAKEVAKRMGVKVEFVPNEWSGMIAGLEKGKFDVVVSQMTITEERKKSMDFTEPYIRNAVSVIVKEDNTTISSIDDFKGEKIGVGLGTNDEAYLREVAMPKVGAFEIATYNDISSILFDLNNGRIAATINNIFAIKPLVDKNNFKIKTVGEPIKEDDAGMAIRKGNPEFLKALDKSLKEMKEDGTYQEIYVKWFGVEPIV